MTSDTHTYLQCGLRMRSEIALALPSAPGGGWDVDVRWGPACEDSAEPPPGTVIASYGSGERRWYTGSEHDDGYHLRFRDCGDFLISRDLTRVEVRPQTGGRVELLPILLAGTVSAFLLTLAGHCVLHASAVEVDGRVLAVVGQSGRGKSTVAALLCVDGAGLVTDDVLRVDPGPPVTCLGGASELRLRTKAQEIASALPDGRGSTRATADERLAFAPGVGLTERLPLGAIVVPAPSRTVRQVEVRSVEPADAVFALLSFPRVHGLARPDLLARQFDLLSRIVATVPTYDVTIPWGPPFSPAVAPALRALVTDEVASPTR